MTQEGVERAELGKKRWTREMPPNETLKALAEIQALEASRHPEVIRFRQKVLGGRLLKPEEVDEWLRAKREEEGRGVVVKLQFPTNPVKDPMDPQWRQALQERLDKAEYLGVEIPGLDYVRLTAVEEERIGHIHAIRLHEVLGWLKRIAEELGKKYGWPEADAVTFVLTGAMPVPPLARITWTWSPERGFYGQAITLQVLPWVSPSEVAALYREIRKETPFGKYVRVHKPKALTEKGRRLAVFLAATPGLSWRERMEQWNATYPQWSYKYIATFRRDALTAYRKVTGSTRVPLFIPAMAPEQTNHATP